MNIGTATAKTIITGKIPKDVILVRVTFRQVPMDYYQHFYPQLQHPYPQLQIIRIHNKKHRITLYPLCGHIRNARRHTFRWSTSNLSFTAFFTSIYWNVMLYANDFDIVPSITFHTHPLGFTCIYLFLIHISEHVISLPQLWHLL